MEPLVDIVLEDARWEAFGLEALAERAALAALEELGFGAEGFSFCVMGCDDARILELNGDFRGKAKPTNVLSWPSEDHVTHLVVHGLLHLLGYDHVRDADGDLMEATEVRILARLGLSDPYSD